MKRALTSLLLMLGLPVLLAAGRPRQAVPTAELETRAEDALFLRSDFAAATAASHAVLQRDPANRVGLFVEMEAAALQAGDAATLDPAIRLAGGNDVAARIAAARIIHLAANTAAFLRHIPELRHWVAAGVPLTADLRAALLQAATEGAPGLSQRQLAADAGLITRWRISPPFGRYGNVDFDRAFAPQADLLSAATYDGRRPEDFEFPDGSVHLPSYFDADGVFYAAGECAGGNVELRFQSRGTAEIFLDGALVLARDDRFQPQPESLAVRLSLAPGRHRVLLKFLASALPFRVQVVAQTPPPGSNLHLSQAAAAYAAALQSFWKGDYDAVLTASAGRSSAPFLYLEGETWRQASPGSPEAVAAWQMALRASPGALAARLRLAQHARDMERAEDAAEELRPVLAANTSSAAAQQLAWELANQDGRPTEELLRALLQVHPTCSAWRDGIKFYADREHFEQATAAEQKLRACAPASLSYADALAARGDHAAAAQAALQVTRQYPLDRDARATAVQELVLAGAPAEARAAAGELAALAPNAPRFRHWDEQLHAATPPAVLDGLSPDPALAAASEFYQPFRRDGVSCVKMTRNREFSGGPAVILAEDRVARLAPDGAVSLYVHELLRVLSRDGIDRYGEVALPEGASLLELRTIQPDGTVAEPELTSNKRTVSMPALAPGSVVEQEYVLRYRDRGGIAAHPDAFRFVFGSFSAPILFARFAVISPGSTPVLIDATENAPAAAVTEVNGVTTRVWELNEIAQSSSETAMPSSGLLPAVSVLPLENSGWAGVRDRYRDELIDATRLGPSVRRVAASLRGNDLDRVRQAYATLLRRVQRDDGSFSGADLTSAEDTLAAAEGSRTAAMVAVLAAAGIPADVLLARALDSPQPSAADPAAYTRPLVRAWIRGPQAVLSPLLLDLESDGMTFGGVPANLARTDALLLTRDAAAQAAIVAFLTPVRDESSADARLVLDPAGNLSARVVITMGPSRSAQMRSILRGIARSGRQHFFDQLALRIFPGADDVNGQVGFEDDVLHPLEIAFTCRAPHFVDLSGVSADIDQIPPALGLRRMYVNAAARRFPLYLDTPLFETATFHLALPTGIALSGGPLDWNLSSTFGSYHASILQPAPGEVEIVRAFHLDPQLIPAVRFADFAAFARRIEDVERQRLRLTHLPTTRAAAAQ